MHPEGSEISSIYGVSVDIRVDVSYSGDFGILGFGDLELNDLKGIFSAGGGENLMVFPGLVDRASGSFLPSDRIWSHPGNWDDLSFLFRAMADGDAWCGHETQKGRDDLRDVCLVHHFHLDAGKKNRSAYRWFAFKDPLRFGNIWFNLGGSYLGWAGMADLWTSPVWMERIRALYPSVAALYRILGAGKLPAYPHSQNLVEAVWRNSPGYAAHRVGPDIYICAGGRARNINLALCDPERWSVFSGGGVMFAQYLLGEPPTLSR